MSVRYASTRLTFKRDVIEPLSDDASFEVETPEGLFRFTKAEFHREFPGVAGSVPYRESGTYDFAKPPRRARPYMVTVAPVAEPRPRHASSMLHGNEPVHRDGAPVGRTVHDFWRWSASDLLSNVWRGVLAEYLVAVALGADGRPRREWVAWDLTTPDGIRVEVKSAAYVQSWHQQRPSPIRFGVGETAGWDPDTAQTSKERKRQADVYVFALLFELDRQVVDPLDVDHWRFIVVACADLNECLNEATDVSLKRLKTVPHREVSFDGVAEAVGSAAGRN